MDVDIYKLNTIIGNGYHQNKIQDGETTIYAYKIYFF